MASSSSTLAYKDYIMPAAWAQEKVAKQTQNNIDALKEAGLLWGQELKHVVHDDFVLEAKKEEVKDVILGDYSKYEYKAQEMLKDLFANQYVNIWDNKNPETPAFVQEYYEKFRQERLLKEALYQTPVSSLWDKDSTTMENTQENLINSLTALFTQPHLAPVQVDTPKGKVTLFEYITMIIAGQHILLTDPELEKAIKNVKVDPMFESVLQNNPHYDRTTLELLAAMVVETGLIPQGTTLDIAKPLSTYMPLTEEGFSQAVKFNAWYEMEFPGARKAISADPIANCLADLASAIKEVKLAPTKVTTTLEQVVNKLNVPVVVPMPAMAVPTEVIVQAQAEVKKVATKAPKAATKKGEVAAGVVGVGTAPQKATTRKRVAVKTADYDPFGE